MWRCCQISKKVGPILVLMTVIDTLQLPGGINFWPAANATWGVICVLRSLGSWLWQRTRLTLDIWWRQQDSIMAPTLRDAIHDSFLAHFSAWKCPCPVAPSEACCITMQIKESVKIWGLCNLREWFKGGTFEVWSDSVSARISLRPRVIFWKIRYVKTFFSLSITCHRSRRKICLHLAAFFFVMKTSFCTMLDPWRYSNDFRHMTYRSNWWCIVPLYTL